jgi:hypothetical protein
MSIKERQQILHARKERRRQRAKERQYNGTINLIENKFPTYYLDGQTFRQKDVQLLFGTNRTTFRSRLIRGWTVREAVYGSRKKF